MTESIYSPETPKVPMKPIFRGCQKEKDYFPSPSAPEALSWKGLLWVIVSTLPQSAVYHDLPKSSFPAWLEQFQGLSLDAYAFSCMLQKPQLRVTNKWRFISLTYQEAPR